MAKSKKPSAILSSSFAVNIGLCARCGGDHTNLTFRRLKNPCMDFTHWAPCPTTHEPILLKRVTKK